MYTVRYLQNLCGCFVCKCIATLCRKRCIVSYIMEPQLIPSTVSDYLCSCVAIPCLCYYGAPINSFYFSLSIMLMLPFAITGLVKILKKYEKRTGPLIRLPSFKMCCSGLSSTLTSCTSLWRSARPCSTNSYHIEQTIRIN